MVLGGEGGGRQRRGARSGREGEEGKGAQRKTPLSDCRASRWITLPRRLRAPLPVGARHARESEPARCASLPREEERRALQRGRAHLRSSCCTASLLADVLSRTRPAELELSSEQIRPHAVWPSSRALPDHVSGPFLKSATRVARGKELLAARLESASASSEDEERGEGGCAAPSCAAQARSLGSSLRAGLDEWAAGGPAGAQAQWAWRAL